VKPPLLRRWADPAWWRYVRYTYPERLIVCGGLVAVALAFGGFVTVSALGSGGASAAAPPAQKSPFGARTAQPASTAAGVRSLPHSSLRGLAAVVHGNSGTPHATSGSALSGRSRARSGKQGSGASAPTQAVAATTTAGHGTTTPTATTTAGTTTAAGTTPTGTTVAVTTPVVTVTVPLP
jgi:hypothetical protein